MEKIFDYIPNGRATIELAIQQKRYLISYFLSEQVQFVAIFTHQFQLLFRECDYPKGFMVWIGLHGVMFLFLFSDFYKSKYTITKKTKVVQNGNEGACMVSVCFNYYHRYKTNIT